jgi:hypothetical protein
MNKRIEKLMMEAGYAAPELAGRAKVFADLLVKDMCDIMMDANVNRCVSTTYDQGIAECTRLEIIKSMSDAYGIRYHVRPKNVKIFPVSTNNSHMEK